MTKSSRLSIASLFVAAVVVAILLGTSSSQAAVGVTEGIESLAQRVSWVLPPVAVLIAIGFYLAFSVSAIGTVGLRRQLKQRIKAEESLKLLYNAVEQSSEGMAVSDLKGRLLFVNHAFASMHGYMPDELKGKELSFLHSEEQLPAVQEANQRLVQYGIFAGEIWHARRDGTPFPTFMHNSMLRADDGRPMGMIATLRDITKQKRVQEDLLRSEEQLKAYSERLEQMVEERTKELDRVRADLFTSAKLAAMGRMGAGIAHQLNSPICGGLLIIDSLLEEKRGDEGLTRRLGLLRGSLEGMRDVIDCMLSMAMIGRRGTPTVQEVDVNDMLQKILAFMGLEVQKRKVDIRQSFAEGLPRIRARVGELDQVFLNLVNNAIDSMDSGGTLGVRTQAADGAVIVEIEDTGRGIQPETMERIFEPFFTTRSGQKGLGLGLSIVREIVASYGGEIDVRSQPGRGSVFVVSLPRRKA